jgi:hypothetical protein
MGAGFSFLGGDSRLFNFGYDLLGDLLIFRLWLKYCLKRNLIK